MYKIHEFINKNLRYLRMAIMWRSSDLSHIQDSHKSKLLYTAVEVSTDIITICLLVKCSTTGKTAQQRSSNVVGVKVCCFISQGIRVLAPNLPGTGDLEMENNT